MSDTPRLTRNQAVIAHNALVRSYNAKRRRPSKRRPSELVMELGEIKDTIDVLAAIIDQEGADGGSVT